MKKIYLSLSLLIMFCGTALSQHVGVNTSGAAPDASAMLDVSSGDKGLLVPRVELTATNVAAPITTPATSLLGLNSIVNYTWQIAIGDQALTAEEFKTLTRENAPLVQIRGRWIEINAGQLAEAHPPLLEDTATAGEVVHRLTADEHVDLGGLRQHPREAEHELGRAAAHGQRQLHGSVVARPVGRDLVLDLVVGQEALHVGRVSRPQVEQHRPRAEPDAEPDLHRARAPGSSSTLTRFLSVRRASKAAEKSSHPTVSLSIGVASTRPRARMRHWAGTPPSSSTQNRPRASPRAA